jgi:hypothetical protein
LVSGVILGAYFGVAKSLSSAVQFFPYFLRALQGTLLGGVAFGLIGGIFGFFFLAVFGFLFDLLINIILSLVGGLKLRASRSGK